MTFYHKLGVVKENNKAGGLLAKNIYEEVTFQSDTPD